MSDSQRQSDSMAMKSEEPVIMTEHHESDEKGVHLEPLEMKDSHTDALGNLVYANDEEEPELHFRTWIALASVGLVLCGQGIAFQGPPTVLSLIGADLGNPAAQTWIVNAMSLVQAVLGPLIASASDVFQVRKPILVASCLLALIGSGIAPGSTNIYRLIGAQALLGVGLSAVPLSYVVPSEILPRRWRPMAQAGAAVIAALTAMMGPLSIGALSRRDPHNGWRQFYWIMFAIWGAGAVGIFFGYRPPKRHTRMDHLSFWQKVGHLDLPGMALFIIGLTLFSVGLSLGGGLYPWSNARTISTIVIGFVVLVAFGLYEWKGTDHGVLSHELFRGGKSRGRNYAILNGLMVVEAVLGFPFIVFYSIMTTMLFTTDPFMIAVRLLPYWGFFLLSCPIWGFLSSKFRTIREPLFLGYFLFTAGNIGLATIQPGDNANQLAFAALAGIGFGSPLILIIAGVQLSTPHHLIATATAVTNSARAVGGVIFTAGYGAALANRLASKIPAYVAEAGGKAGVAPAALPVFIGGISTYNQTLLGDIPGLTPAAVSQGFSALQQAWADSLRVVPMIAAPFGVVACIGCLFLGDLKKVMTYRVDAPVEDLHAKNYHRETVTPA